MYLFYQNLPGIYKPPVLSKLFIHRPSSTLTTLLSKTSPTPQDLSAPPPAALDDPYGRILLLEFLERHQELLYYCYWLIHAQSTAAVPVSHCSCAPRRPQLALFPGCSHAQSTAAVPVPPCSCPPRGPQLFLDVLPKCTLRTCYPSAHPRTCYPSAHPRTCYPNAWYTRAP